MARPKTTEPSDRHLKILSAIIEWTREGDPPVISEISREVGYASASGLCSVLKVMERMGLVETTQRGRGKIVSATRTGREAVGIRGIPLVGTIHAGNLSEVVESATQFVELTDLIPYKQGDFLLRVEGESMIEAGILSGDTVLVRPDVEPRQGEIAAVLVSTEHKATLKRVFFDRTKKEVRLQAANPAFPDQIFRDEDVHIAGVYQALVRYRGGIGVDAS